MSTIIEGTKIYMTRGDTPTLDIQAIIISTNTAYSMAAGDTMYFRLAQEPLIETTLLEKTVTNGQLTFTPSDTASLDFGTYVYSLELVTAGGYHETFVRPIPTEGVFKIGEELENHGS